MDDAHDDAAAPTDPELDPQQMDEEPAFTSEIPVSNLARQVASDRQDALSERPVHDFIAEARINVPTRGNRVLEQVLERINADDELRTWWHIGNLNAVARMGMNDHSWVHMQIVANIGVKLTRLLFRAGVEPAMVTDYGLTRKDAEVVVLLGCLLHDVGMSIHRNGHEEFSLFLADRKAHQLLDGLYDEITRTVIVSETLQSIISHRSGGMPLTVEAGIVRVADSLDMTHGRSRIPFEQGSLSIHAVSAAAIDRVRLTSGEERAIRVHIEMNNTSGVFQVDELLRKKLKGSGLEEHVEIEVIVHEQEKRLLDRFTL
ncbi:MAG: metal dependent phosphohydrolase [Thermoleophilia bacterium]|jgi:metal-dependent HD superfamily phosphatase/phosphodiesterase|nr:metal dependent phosphohydrolase [Thermoleophilia bacterium]